MITMSKLLRPVPDRTVGPRRAPRKPSVGVVFAALPALFFLSAPRDAMPQERDGERVTITGRVVDALTGNPIAGVEVVVRGAGGPGGDLQVETGDDGEFVLSSIAVGEYRLQLNHLEYNPAVGDFSVMRPGRFITSMKPLAQGSDELMTGIIGVVTDRESGALMSGVSVSMGGGQRGVFSDLRGEFVLDRLIGGQHVVEFSMIGYTPRADTIRVTPGRVTTVEVSLSVDPVVLDPIEVAVERRQVVLQQRGFYHRRDVGFGQFLDRQQIEDRAPTEMTDLFTGMAGVDLYSDPLNSLEKWVVLRSGRISSSFHRDSGVEGQPQPSDVYGRCFPRVYLDGFIVHGGGDEPARMDNIVDPTAVSGIEIYQSVSGLPPEYQGSGTFCGTILIWTRR